MRKIILLFIFIIPSYVFAKTDLDNINKSHIFGVEFKKSLDILGDSVDIKHELIHKITIDSTNYISQYVFTIMTTNIKLTIAYYKGSNSTKLIKIQVGDEFIQPTQSNFDKLISEHRK